MKNSKKNEEKWIWVEGYKGTDKYMTCRDFRFNLNSIHSLPEGEEVLLCSSGFHFCRNLRDVFRYYDVENGNRFFKVRGLIKNNEDECVKALFTPLYWDSKLAAKSIEFIEELSADEILAAKNVDISGWTEDQKKRCFEVGPMAIFNEIRTTKLVELGFAQDFAKYIVEKGKYADAVAISSQTDLSMDVKCLLIFGFVQRDAEKFLTNGFNLGVNSAFGLTNMDATTIQSAVSKISTSATEAAKTLNGWTKTEINKIFGANSITTK